MQVENGPHFGVCEACRRCSQSEVPAEVWFRKRLNVRVRIVCAVGASKPEEILCWLPHSWSSRVSSRKSQRHSTALLGFGNMAIRRNGFMLGSGRFESPICTASGESVVL